MRKNEPVLDRLPEFTSYDDNGCDLYPSCLTCPLPRCRYDDPGWIQREERRRRDVAILEARLGESLGVPQLANRFGLSTRTIHRILRRDPAPHAAAA